MRADAILTWRGLDAVFSTLGESAPDGFDAEWAWEAQEAAVAAWIAQAGPALAHAALAIQAVGALGDVVVDGALPGPVLDRLIDAGRKAITEIAVAPTALPVLHRGTLGHSAAARGAAQLPVHAAYFTAPERAAGQ